MWFRFFNLLFFVECYVILLMIQNIWFLMNFKYTRNMQKHAKIIQLHADALKFLHKTLIKSWLNNFTIDSTYLKQISMHDKLILSYYLVHCLWQTNGNQFYELITLSKVVLQNKLLWINANTFASSDYFNPDFNALLLW